MKIFEETISLKAFGVVGLPFLDVHRFYMMSFLALLSFLSCVLMIVAASAASAASGTIKATAWTYQLSKSGDFYDIDTYLGLTGYSNDSGAGTWSDCTESYCSKCNIAGDNERNISIIVFILAVPITISCVARRNADDLILHKLIIFVGSVACVAMIVVALIEWSVQCVGNLPTAGGLVYGLGVGFNCVVTTLFFLLFVSLINLLTPLKKRRSVVKENSREMPSATSNANPMSNVI